MKTSLKRLVTGISAIGLGFGIALPSMAQSTFTPNADRDSTAPQSSGNRAGNATPNAETTAPNSPTPAPTNRDAGIPPVGGAQRGQSSGSMSTPSNSGNNSGNNSGTPNGSGLPNNQSVPGVVAPANRPEVNNTPNGSTPSGSASTSTPSYSSAGSEGQTIDQIVRTSPSFELFNALVRVADSNSNGAFSASLTSGGDYTVFAPTDEALAAIPPATFKALVQPENRALLVQVLENHIVKGKVTSADLAAKQVQSMGGSPIAAQGGMGSLMIGNARVLGSDIQASNGIIHVVDQVLLPAGVQAKLTSLAPQASMPMSKP